MSIDQAYKQNNKMIKTDGGATNILTSSLALMKWYFFGSYMAATFTDFNEEDQMESNLLNHNENKTSF